jgi:hypothetical protein
MPAASRYRASLVETWRALNTEQRTAGVGAVLLAVSTLGPFSWVEAAVVVVALAILFLLKKRADGAAFHLPFGDGTMIAAAGVWAAILVLTRLFDRSLGQELLALLCAAIIVVAGLSERANRPPDDVPTEPLGTRESPAGASGERSAEAGSQRPLEAPADRPARAPAQPPAQAPAEPRHGPPPPGDLTRGDRPPAERRRP